MKTCLTCLQLNGVEPISSTHKTLNLPLSEIITYCTTIEPQQTASHPAHICANCLCTLTLIYQFKRKALDNQTKLSNQPLIDLSDDPDTSLEHIIIEFEPPIADRLDFQFAAVIDPGEVGVGSARRACAKCDRTFARAGALRAHARSHTDRPFACAVCNRGFQRRRARDRHALLHASARRHGAGKRFKCTLCERSFVQKRSLGAHMCQHTGVMPFRCDECGRGFTRELYLKNHRIVKHGDC